MKGNEPSHYPSLSADAARVAFQSSATNLDAADTDQVVDVFVKDLGSGAITLASTSSGGTKGDKASRHPDISGDGSRVGFDSLASNLVPKIPVGASEVYKKELAPTPTPMG